MPQLDLIRIYPLKSLDPLALTSAAITRGGSLRGDREYALKDDERRIINGKRFPRIHAIRSTFDLDRGVITLSSFGSMGSLQARLPSEAGRVEEWLSRYFGSRVHLEQNTLTGFPDDTDATGPTIVSSATLEEVVTWYNGMTVADLRRRFRPNLEIGGVPAFWEDQLFTDSGAPVKFKIGDVVLQGTGPCARCPVPGRDPDSGDVLDGFQRVFVENRRRTLPGWVAQGRFDHFYRLTVNTRISMDQEGKAVNVGDECSIEVV